MSTVLNIYKMYTVWILFAGGRGRSFADASTWGAPSVEIIGEVIDNYFGDGDGDDDDGDDDDDDYDDDDAGTWGGIHYPNPPPRSGSMGRRSYLLVPGSSPIL